MYMKCFEHSKAIQGLINLIFFRVHYLGFLHQKDEAHSVHVTMSQEHQGLSYTESNYWSIQLSIVNTGWQRFSIFRQGVLPVYLEMPGIAPGTFCMQSISCPICAKYVLELTAKQLIAGEQYPGALFLCVADRSNHMNLPEPQGQHQRPSCHQLKFRLVGRERSFLVVVT